MEQTTVSMTTTTASNVNNMKNLRTDNQKNLSDLDIMTQELAGLSFYQIFNNIFIDSQNETDSQEILMGLSSVLKNSEKSDELLTWFQGLSQEQQEVVYQILANIDSADSINNFLSPIKGNQQLKVVLKDHEFKLRGFWDKLQEMNINQDQDDKLEFLQKEPIKLSKNVSLLKEKDNTKIVPGDKVLNYLNNLFVEQHLSAEQEVDQLKQGGVKQIELQRIDINQVDLASLQFQNIKQIKSENINISDGYQNLINVENQDFTSELGKVLIKNIKMPNGVTETKIQLHPEELGRISVKLTASNGQLAAQIIADTSLGKALLEGQIQQLKHSLIQQGYQVEKIEVLQMSSSSSSYSNSNGFNFSDNQPTKQQYYGRSSYSVPTVDEEEISEQNLFSLSGIDYTV
ncbi:hypothetical protein BHF71_00405 [Vulcanibacillus modesticaldus]|uniref:Flagellar hook-length control protein-like C-terminal domain-containing protein n=1 Tax=Vulcanibacillus modesticaldus TaxID=337097 RepID=A0A1D2YXC4_9BACI|nr:flagellar hook-length control protein FliK [Vulcanibacillus modesticaldus]OEG00405.1 hypothetical protein BHF71_00405 [Vulcanibacillus modesticaldus]